jgi:hypothetical protein
MDKEMEKEQEVTELNKLVDIYLKQLTPFQIKANEIAIRKLDSSYCIEKSIGFLDFKKKYN